MSLTRAPLRTRRWLEGSTRLARAARLACRRLPPALWASVLLALVATPIAQAQPWVGSKSVPNTGVELQLQPALGVPSPASGGWLSLLVHVHNKRPTELSGRVVVRVAADKRRRSREAALAEAELTVASGETLWLRLPTHGADSPELTATLYDAHNVPIADASTLLGPIDQPHVFDLSPASSLVAAMKRRAAMRRLTFDDARDEVPLASGVVLDPVDQHPLLPERAAEYGPTSLVIASQQELESLSDAAWVALGGWVLAGGCLALGPSAATTGGPRLERLVGGGVERGPWSESLIPANSADKPQFGPRRAPLEESPASMVALEDLQRELVGFRGGNLRPTNWGHAASYGLGEVHLLGFDPSAPTLADSNWLHDKLAQLVRHAKQRRRSVVLPLGRQNPDDARTYAVRGAFTQPRGSPWFFAGLGALLFGYVTLAGPVNFRRAQRSQRPLQALPWLAGLALLTSGLILATKSRLGGMHAAARHLSLVEAGAGMPRAVITRFRGFFAEDFGGLNIAALEPEALLAVVNSDHDVTSRSESPRTSMRLTGIRTRPWKTVVVREESFVGLGGGVALYARGTDVTIQNATGRDLLGVVVRAADGRTYYYPRIRTGETLTTSPQQWVQVLGAPARATYYPLLLHNFDWRMDEAASGLASAWRAVESLRSGEVDWWPPDVPVLIAQVDGGEGRAADSGYPLEADRLLLRVVGFGGEPTP